METDDQIDTELEDLRADAEFGEPLKRVSFVEGMLLGQEATRAEQAYHRRRLNRHQYWLHGMGTIAGLAVSVLEQPVDIGTRTELLVHPGLALDALGRELVVGETYCLDLDRWLATREPDSLTPGLGPEQGGRRPLYCYLTIRHDPCGHNLAPVLARKLNAGTDAVDFTRIGDGFLLELALDTSLGDEDANWARGLVALDGIGEAAPLALSDREDQFLADQADPAFEAEALRRRRLLGLFSAHLPGPQPDQTQQQIEAQARVPLASVRLSLPVDAGGLRLQANAADVAVNNLMRPFVRSALHQQLSSPF